MLVIHPRRDSVLNESHRMRGIRQPQRKPGGGNLPPFWIQADNNGSRLDSRVVDESKDLWPWAYHHVEVVLHDATRAAELLEEVAIDVSERLQKKPDVSWNLKGYLITAFRNRVSLELLRASRITYEGLVSELEGKHRLIAPNWLGPLEISICVAQIIPFMPPDARRIVNYRLLDFEWGEIAEAMGIQVMQAKNKYYYGIRTAWESLGPDGNRKQRRENKRPDETEAD